MRKYRNTSKIQGFTLIELMIALAIGGILVVLAVPSFNQATSSTLVTTQSNNLISSLNLALSEAVKRASNVTVCASTDQATCGGTDWTAGWIVRLDSDNSVLRSQEAFTGNTTVAYSPAAISAVQFNRLGQANLTPALTISLTPGGCISGSQGLHVVTISPTGRAGVQEKVCA